MNIIEQNKKKINGILETFDRMIINGYSLNLCNYRHFLYYLIQNDVKLVDFDKFAQKETETLCNHIDNYIKNNNVETIYLNSGKIDKNEIVMNELEKNPNNFLEKANDKQEAALNYSLNQIYYFFFKFEAIIITFISAVP